MIYLGFGINNMSIRVSHVYIVICVSCMLMHRGTAAPGDRMSPARWLSMYPDKCKNDEEMKPEDSLTIFWTGRHYYCSSCKVKDENLVSHGGSYDRYHIKYSQVQPWQLNEEGMQVCLSCPKWTFHYNHMKQLYIDWDTDPVARYDIWDDVKKPTCMSQCPWKLDGVCTGNVVSQDDEGRRNCNVCEEGYIPFELNIWGQSGGHSALVYGGSLGEVLSYSIDIYWKQTQIDLVQDILSLPNLKDFSTMHACKRCPRGMYPADMSWNGELGSVGSYDRVEQAPSVLPLLVRSTCYSMHVQRRIPTAGTSGLHKVEMIGRLTTRRRNMNTR